MSNLGAGLASTSRGRAWLENFDDADKNAATLLLDSVELVTSAEFRSGFKDLVFGLSDSSIELPKAAFAVQGVPKDQRAYNFFEPDGELHQVGSELIIQHLLEKTSEKTLFLLGADLEALKSHAVRVIYLVTDQIGTGSEVIDFLDHLWRHRTIRSWHSSKHIRFEVVSFMSSETGLRTLSWDKRIATVHLARMARTVQTADWSWEEQRQIQDLSSRYSDIKPGRPDWGRVGTLTVLEHSFGNGAPRVLLRGKSRDRREWNQLLPNGRAWGLSSSDETRVNGYKPKFSPTRVLDGIAYRYMKRQLKRNEREALSKVSGTTMRVPLTYLLVALRVGIDDEKRLMQVTNMSHGRLLDITNLAQELGLLDSAMQVTASGRSFVRRQGSFARTYRMKATLFGSSDAYYPSQLR